MISRIPKTKSRETQSPAAFSAAQTAAHHSAPSEPHTAFLLMQKTLGNQGIQKWAGSGAIRRKSILVEKLQRQPKQREEADICPSGHKIGENLVPPINFNGKIVTYGIWGTWRESDNANPREFDIRTISAWVTWRFGNISAEQQKNARDYLLSIQPEKVEHITPRVGCQYAIGLAQKDYYKTRVLTGEAQKDATGGGKKAGKPGGAMLPAELVHIGKYYDFLLKKFPGHDVFVQFKATMDDLVVFAGNRPEAYKALPPIPKDGQPLIETLPWDNFLNLWRAFMEALQKGRQGGEPGGVEGGIVRFDASAELNIRNEKDKYVKGGELSFGVQFDRTSDDNYFMNFHPFVRRAVFDWTIYHEGKEYDSGPIFDRGEREYALNLKKTGTYSAKVVVSSPYFKNGSLELEKVNIPVVEEQARAEEVFNSLLADPNNPDAPYARDESGQLKLKAGKPLSVQEEIIKLDIEIGAVKGLLNQVPQKITQAQADTYIQYLTDQKKALEELLKEEANPDFKRYIVYGTFLSRENSQFFEIKAFMQRKSRKTSAIRAVYKVELLDATLDPANPTHHPGEGKYEHYSRRGWQDHGWVKAEQKAIDDMADHWHGHNDYPKGVVTLGINRIEDGQLVKVGPIDTANAIKTAKSILGVVALVGGVVALAASPFTGGTSASVGVILIKGVAVTAAVAGVGATLLELQDRYQKEGTLKLDRRLLLDILSIVGAVMGAGGFLKVLREAGKVGKMIYLTGNLGLDIASGVLMTEETRREINKIEAIYAKKLAVEDDPAKRAALIRERDSAVAQMIGNAAINNAFILVSMAGGVHQIVSISGPKSLKSYTVRKEIVDFAAGAKSEPELIRSRLEDPKLLPEERFYLEEALLVPNKGAVPTSKGEVVEQKIGKLGAMTDDTREMLRRPENEKLLGALNENPLASRALKHCSKFCFPENATPEQIATLQKALQRLGKTGSYDEAVLREYLNNNRAKLDEAIAAIDKQKTAKDLNAALNSLGEAYVPDAVEKRSARDRTREVIGAKLEEIKRRQAENQAKLDELGQQIFAVKRDILSLKEKVKNNPRGSEARTGAVEELKAAQERLEGLNDEHVGYLEERTKLRNNTQRLNEALTLERPALREAVKLAIEKTAKKAPDGRFLDANTGLPIDGPAHYGHIYGKEHRRLALEARERGMNQAQFNDWVNNHPEWFQIESVESNLSHRFEKPGID